ncbi:FecR domain-containing protein [uncultured Bacteroides sp.]|uniref:FecR family protein n=1 Tax=uncultured Bacteroides sp. TaxID=162156 RepID=UPI002AA65364|nr:FecR domain-containing protein [uncultured Bacteroides sp.]
MVKMNFTSGGKEKFLKELSVIYYRCLVGKATDSELKIAEKFGHHLIEKLQKFPAKQQPMAEVEEEKMEVMWKRITEQLHMECPLPETEVSFSDEDYHKAYEEEWKKTYKKVRKLIVRRSVWQGYAAAVALIAVLLGTTLFFYADKNKVMSSVVASVKVRYTATNSLNRYTLEDGTLAEMNRDSELKIAGSFNNKTREVAMEGQIFFKVKKNPEKPFIISTQGMNVTVRGTSFEVMSYEEIEDKQVTVSTGRVEVTDSKNGKLLAILTPGLQLIFNPDTGSHELKKVNAEEITAWRTGKLVLHNASVSELRLRLRQYFGKVLLVEGGALREDARITSTFNYEDVTIDNVMKRICALFGAKYKIQSNRVILSVNTI